METEDSTTLSTDSTGRFVAGKSGNPIGRPKGSKNKVTLLKLMAEESIRDNNFERMQQVCDTVIKDALEGDRSCQKLVWQAMISKSSADDQATAKEKVSININTGDKKPQGIIIDADSEETP